MKSKRGFTLVEVIISITLLAILGLVVGLNLNKVFKKGNESDYEDFIANVKIASDVYLAHNNGLISELNSNKGFILITISDLIKEGLIAEDIKNPQTGEIVNQAEYVLASLDDMGVVKFTYPAATPEEHLQTLNKVVEFEEQNVNCKVDLDTINLGLIDKNGNLVEDYFSTYPERITCKRENENIDTNKIGTFTVSYSYITQDEITKEATRNFIVVDSIPPLITEVSYTPTSWTNGNVTITAKVIDNESGIDSYSISKGDCSSFIKTTSASVSGIATENGDYYVCAKDRFGNIARTKVTITNIDKNLPTIGTISKSTEDWVSSLTISATLTDNESGVTAYAINQTSSVGSVSWTNFAATSNKAVTYTLSNNGTYYVWAKDAVGNVTSKTITINNIGILRTATINTGETNYTYSGAFNTGYSIKAIKSSRVSTGMVSNVYYSGSYLYYTVSGGYQYSGTYNSTCTMGASYTSPTYTSVCSSYYCSRGGSVSGSMCVGYTTSGSGYNEYTCSSMGTGWYQSYASNLVNCSTGYTKTFSCGAAPPSSGTTCTAGSKKTVSCTGYCNWNGNYAATCSSSYQQASCPAGYSMSGSGCYRCSTGSLSGTTCYYSCSQVYYYYSYQVTIEYYS